MLEPPGFEPGTSFLKECSSTGIRRNFLKKGVTRVMEDFMLGANRTQIRFIPDSSKLVAELM
jgi:hypothetical protein